MGPCLLEPGNLDPSSLAGPPRVVDTIVIRNAEDDIDLAIVIVRKLVIAASKTEAFGIKMYIPSAIRNSALKLPVT
tara:strand:+ start:1325 stop:1552 length:228 start_codon:yes stop_codon:yes gene_type:complete